MAQLRGSGAAAAVRIRLRGNARVDCTASNEPTDAALRMRAAGVQTRPHGSERAGLRVVSLTRSSAAAAVELLLRGNARVDCTASNRHTDRRA